jgi:hypothetical protein
MVDMTSDQPFLKFGQVEHYYLNGSAVDDFDLSIRQVPGKENEEHARVELVFLQEKGSLKKPEVVAAVRMQAHQLEELQGLIQRQLDSFRKSKD